MALRRIPVSEARVLRGRVLTEDGLASRSVYPGDDAPDTLHLGAFVNSRLAAVATVCRESMSVASDSSEWRLRGMATLEEFRGRGLGKRLAERCVAHAVDGQGTVLWCSARYRNAPVLSFSGFQGTR
jgi:GNAT superfamily N-acetyltransferase